MPRNIFAVGDSHALRCFENHPYIVDAKALFGYNKLDGRTAFNLARHDKHVRKIMQAIRGNHIIFVFGEVDVRIHIKYQCRLTGISTDELIDNTANRYTAYIGGLREQDLDIHVFNVVPTGDFTTPEAQRWKDNLNYPFTATYQERTAYTEEMNRRFEWYCLLRHIPFINIYPYLVDKQGRRKKELIYDYSHLNNKTADLVMKHYCFEDTQIPQPICDRP